ncbi:hypothetical protein LOTGIDRAFT_128172 [Lottia gigantea]|uniref:CN hydrolase domain-containing protein n=1 Tax=Lottia gigantea TaxID=225164 RepID=V4A0Y8_LOTGI|nr:hypothetical protein LOTGIDRAFT_128172 [Lottia gigantea]ESO86941.1 hypothetical protein LOTGIDRAFT_128172 [Lottia gigantea]
MELTVLLCLVIAGINVCMGLRPSYRAAVYEHAVIMPVNIRTVSRSQALVNMKKNLDIYEEQVRRAAGENVDIIVFPEDGIYGVNFNRDTIKPYLEDIPDPQSVSWTPCNRTNITQGSEVQTRLSCMAREHNIYIVANMGDKKPCDSNTDVSCTDGQYQYNTNVVFDPQGRLVARYHKQNLYFEAQFDTPKIPERVTFQTPFGKFGVFTCFDILFKTPAVDLIDELGVENVVLPTAWMDSLPLLAAIQFHSAFAKHFKINLLAANIHFPLFNFHGSGIYSPKRTESYYYNDGLFSGGKLLIADVKCNPRQHRRHFNVISNTDPIQLFSLSRQMMMAGWIHMMNNQDNFQYIPLTQAKAKVKVCQGEVCCYLDYQKLNGTEELYALGVFDGIHQIDGLQWYTQVCVMLKCESTDISSCGRPTKEANGHFNYIKLWGTFTTPYVFPQILVSHRGQLRLEHEHWKYRQNRIEFVNRGREKPLLSASLYGRNYDRDHSSPSEQD